MEQFDYSDKVRKLEDVIPVDDQVQGCPMNAALFLSTLQKYLEIFKIV